MRYAEIVVNRAIVQRQKVIDGDASHTEWRTNTDTRLQTFHYHILSDLENTLRPGHLVAVPFRNQMLQGVVIALSDESPVAKTKAVAALLDDEPLLTPIQLSLAKWLSREYLAPLSTCVNYFLPPGANRKPMTVVEALGDTPAPPNLPAAEGVLLRFLQLQNKPIPLEKLDARTVKLLEEKGIVRKRATLSKPRIGPRIERTAELLIQPESFEDALDLLGRKSKQAEILRFLENSDDPFPTLENVKTEVGVASDSPFKALASRGWVELLPAQTLLTLSPQFSVDDIPSTEGQVVWQKIVRAGRTVLSSTLNEADLLTARWLRDQHFLIDIEEKPRVTLKLPPPEIPAAIIALKGTAKHAAVLEMLAQEDGAVWIGWIYVQTDATQKHLQDLARVGAIAMDEARRWRNPLAGKSFTLSSAPTLTAEQNDIMQTILPALGEHGKPFLIHGVTGSGKTEIYLQAIDRVLRQGRGAIFLVPEVMLATQIVERVRARFPKKVAVWHSSLSLGERFDTWERVRNGDLPIVVGPRSALFAPLQKLGLIIIDEEHEAAFKQSRTPTYHAREAAIEYARLCDIPVIMGSATPDVVSYRKAQRKEYHLLTLPNRILAHQRHLAVQANLLHRSKRSGTLNMLSSKDGIATREMPPVQIVDLREELKAGNRSIFSRALTQAINKTLDANEQVILFLNRRGTATFVMCRDCGYVAECPQCDTTLTFHNPGQQMVCHNCGFHTATPTTCPECHSKRIRYFGLGTERVEAMLKREFPQARPIRLDQDNTRKRGSHYTFLQHFVEGRANVMIGTQMVAKGLDLPLVTLVGIISADTALYLPDFRAAERTFQVLTQVAGRAGRSPLGGQVILQTYTPYQPSIVAASQHDYLTFYQDELRFRYEQGYPPFKRLARLTFIGNGEIRSRENAEDMAEQLRLWVDREGFPAVEIIGPAPTYVQRVGNRFQWQIILRAPDPAAVLRPVPLPLNWRVDIDPVSLL